MRYVALGDIIEFDFSVLDAASDMAAKNFDSGSGGYLVEHGSAVDAVPVTGGVTIEQRTGAGMGSVGQYRLVVNSSNDAFLGKGGVIYSPYVKGIVQAAGSQTHAPVGEDFILQELMEAADVQAECEDAIKAVLLPLYSTIAAVNSQVSIDLTTGPATDDALNGAEILFRDSSGLVAGFATVLDYDGANKRLTLNHAAQQTITTAHTATVLPAGQRRALGRVEAKVLFFTVTAVTDSTNFAVTITDWWGATLSTSDIGDDALAQKAMIMESVGGGSSTTVFDNATISSADWDASETRWDITTLTSDALIGAPAVGDTGIIALFG